MRIVDNIPEFKDFTMRSDFDGTNAKTGVSRSIGYGDMSAQWVIVVDFVKILRITGHVICTARVLEETSLLNNCVVLMILKNFSCASKAHSNISGEGRFIRARTRRAIVYIVIAIVLLATLLLFPFPFFDFTLGLGLGCLLGVLGPARVGRVFPSTMIAF
jgi:hypothetical protein